jgi:hypothetical protein
VDDKLVFFRQQFNSVERKKQERENSLKELAAERRELEKEKEQKMAELEEINPLKV